MAPPSKQTHKPVFKTSSPFTETKWPEISQQEQNIILDLVCNLISPLGEHRHAHIHPSKGKKRKRSAKASKNDGSTGADAAPPPVPEISGHILVGHNSVTRHLEALAARNAPRTALVAAPNNFKSDEQQASNIPRALSILIIPHPNPSGSPAHAHLPTLLHISALSCPSSTSTRLITLPVSRDAVLAAALHIPRVSALGILDGAPGAKALEEYVRANVEATECTWLSEAMKAGWRGPNVKAG